MEFIKKNKKMTLIILGIIIFSILTLIFAIQGVQDRAFTIEEQVNAAESE